MKNECFAVVGLGYVGLPVALAFSRKYSDVIGFDVKERRIAELKSGIDTTQEATSEELASSKIRFTSDSTDLEGVTFFIVAVPTPIDKNRKPDLSHLESACRIVGSILRLGTIVVFESTVYPGVTEEFCGPILAKVSGLSQGVDFFLGYSPERINPGDREHGLKDIVKIVAGQDEKTRKRVSQAYAGVVEAGIYEAESIRIAEAAKVIENTQRDLNIALMNELALIFDRLGINTNSVLEAAATKWNFLNFKPGLVGGHCIGVDPYYLTSKAESVDYHPEVILAGRRINDSMGRYIAQKLIRMLSQNGFSVPQARVGILGLTFKENVPDLRNSKVVDIYNELVSFGLRALVHDPYAVEEDVIAEMSALPTDYEEWADLDGLILAVAHRQYKQSIDKILTLLKPGGILIDVKSIVSEQASNNSVVYWSL